MLSIWFYLTSLCVGTAMSIACFVCVPVVLKRARQARNMLKRVDSARFYAFERRVGQQLWRGMPWALRHHLRRLVGGEQDGETYVPTVHQLLGRQALLVIAMATLLPFSIKLGALTMGGAVILPYWRYRKKQKAVQKQLRHQLPFFMDVFALSVEAGAGIVLALQNTAEVLPSGPLKQAVEQAVFDMASGLDRELSFRKMANESGVAELEVFVNNIENAMQMGLSLGPVLRAQSDQYQAERFLRSEKAALEAPVKMLFPIVCCILPCTFLVIAFPIVHRLLLAF